MIHRRKLLLGCAATFAMVALSFQAAPVSAADPVKVGVVLPLTGGMAPFGQASLRGVQLVVDEINASGGLEELGGATIELVTGDAGGDPTTAASVTQRLISRDRVVAILGCFASSLSLAASEVSERSHVPFLTMSFTDKLTARGFKYIFQVVPKASTIGASQLDYMLDIAAMANRPIKRIAILYEDTAYGSSQAEGLEKHAEELGLEVPLAEGYPKGLTDATPLIQKLKAADVDAVFPVSYFTDAVLIIRAMRQNGMDTMVVGGAAGYVIPEFQEALGKFTEGIFSVNTSNYDNYGKLGEAYRQKYGQFMTHEAFEHAVLMAALAEAINTAKSADPAAIGAALHALSMTDYPASGLPGDGIRFDDTGLNILTHPVMVQWQGGELVTVWPESDAKGKPNLK